MKKNYFLLLLAILIASLSINAQNLFVPDTAFRSYLNTEFPTYMDASGDSLLADSAASFTGMISISNYNIVDIEGIQLFTNLTSLRSSYSGITQVDLSQNTALTEIVLYSNQLTSLDVSNNIAVSWINCRGNQLTSLDLSQNVNLDRLQCDDNQLTSLDLSQNVLLESLSCNSNQLEELNLSHCPELNHISCASNQLTELDLSQNANLQSIFCGYNQITALDLSHCPHVFALFCYDNNLSELDLTNGTHHIMFCEFVAQNNPNLFCVQVDSLPYAQQNLQGGLDPQATFSTNCLYGIENPKNISGQVLIDNDCVLDTNPEGMSGIIVHTEPYNQYAVTDSLGYYSIVTDSGYTDVYANITNPLVTTLCPNSGYHTIYFDTLDNDTTGINFFTEVIDCPLLTVSLDSDRRRRCFTNNTYVEYCNDGFADALDVEVVVSFPEYVIFQSADHPYSIDVDGNFVFEIGDLSPSECGTIHIIDSVACIENITGLTQCTEAMIFPPNTCLEALDTAANNAWDHSSIMVEGFCIDDTLIQFVITNTGDWGDGDMENPHEYRIFVDNALDITNTFQLNGGESITIDYPANGQTVRLEADQHPNHPGNSQPQEAIEACGDNNGEISIGFINSVAQDDADYDIDIDCLPIRDSYDPNDKRVSPEGITENHYVPAGVELDYQIRFQNTGTDTAFTVVILDTLSSNLNPATIVWGNSSHPYTIEVSGMGTPVLKFTFNNINLPDSTTNQLESNGYVNFKVKTYPDLENGVVVNNKAYIYFDYNAAIITNTTSLTISDTVLTYIPVQVQELNASNLSIYPNPTTGKISIDVEQFIQAEIYNMSGALLATSKQKDVDLSTYEKGVYFVKVISTKGTETRRLILE